jgi:hypothetical protein
MHVLLILLHACIMPPHLSPLPLSYYCIIPCPFLLPCLLLSRPDLSRLPLVSAKSSDFNQIEPLLFPSLVAGGRVASLFVKYQLVLAVRPPQMNLSPSRWSGVIELSE